MLVLWFTAIALCWAAFFALEGFGLGVGALLPLVGHDDGERHAVARTLLPPWDGNEGWLIVGGLATFFAFRGWFDALVSGFGVLFLFIFAGLVLRTLALHARRTVTSRHHLLDSVTFASSVAPAFLFGVLFANFLRGVTVRPSGHMVRNLGELFSPYAMLGGLVALALVLFEGALFLSLRTNGRTQRTARNVIRVVAPLAGLGAVRFIALTARLRFGERSWLLGTSIMVLLSLAVILALVGKYRRAFLTSVAATLLLPLWVFATLWPNVLPDRTAPWHSLTVHNTHASGGAFTVLTIVSVELGALLAVYLTWSYWIFHSRITGRNVIDAEHEHTVAVQEAMDADGAVLVVPARVVHLADGLRLDTRPFVSDAGSDGKRTDLRIPAG